MKFLLPLLSISILPLPAFGIDKLPKPASRFVVDGHIGFVMDAEQPATGKPWVWYAPTLPFLPDRSHLFYIEQCHRHGIAWAGYDQGDVRGSDEKSAKFTAFYHVMVAKGYSKKPILLGQSRGGFMMLNWAVRHPDKVGGFAGIYPVLNMSSWPLKNVKDSVLAEYRLTEQQILANLAVLNPVERLDGLAERNVPMFVVYGDNDKVVPHDENSLVLKANYEKLGGKVEEKIVPGGGHTGGPGYFNEPELAKFLIRVGTTGK